MGWTISYVSSLHACRLIVLASQSHVLASWHFSMYNYSPRGLWPHLDLECLCSLGDSVNVMHYNMLSGGLWVRLCHAEFDKLFRGILDIFLVYQTAWSYRYWSTAMKGHKVIMWLSPIPSAQSVLTGYLFSSVPPQSQAGLQSHGLGVGKWSSRGNIQCWCQLRVWQQWTCIYRKEYI